MRDDTCGGYSQDSKIPIRGLMSLRPSDRCIRIETRTSSTNRHYLSFARFNGNHKVNDLVNFPNVCESCR